MFRRKQPNYLVAGTKAFFLVDTGQERNAADYILRFTTRYDNDPGFAREINAKWTMNANAAIEALLTGNRKALWEQTAQLSNFQLKKVPRFHPCSPS